MADINDFKNKNTKFTGTTGQRISTGATGTRVNETGRLRFNTTTNLMEYYTGTEWKSIDSPPIVNSISPSNVNTFTLSADSTTSVTFTIIGSGFSAAGTTIVTFIANSGSPATFTANTVTVNSSTSITAIVNNKHINFINANEPFDVKVENASGLSSTLADAVSVNEAPSWVTAAGSIGGTIYESNSVNISVQATDPEGGSVNYNVTAGSLPTGLSLNSGTGAITGTASTAGTFNFTITARDSGSSAASRNFSMTINILLDGSTIAAANTTCSAIYALGAVGTARTDGLKYLTSPNGTATQFYCDQTLDGGGWMLVFRCDNESTYCNNGTWDFYVLDGGGTNPPTTPFGDASTSGTASTYGGSVQRSGGNPASRSSWWNNISATSYMVEIGTSTAAIAAFKGTQTNASDMFAYAAKGTANGSPSTGFSNAVVGTLTAVMTATTNGGTYTSGSTYSYYSHGHYACNCCEAYHASTSQSGVMLFGDDLGRNGYAWSSFFIK